MVYSYLNFRNTDNQLIPHQKLSAKDIQILSANMIPKKTIPQNQ